MKNNCAKEINDSVARVLSQHKNPLGALELRELCMLARVSATEAFRAVNHLMNVGFKIRPTDGLPHKFYYENG